MLGGGEVGGWHVMRRAGLVSRASRNRVQGRHVAGARGDCEVTASTPLSLHFSEEIPGRLPDFARALNFSGQTVQGRKGGQRDI